MSLQEISKTAFAKWLLSVDPTTAISHLASCLKNGPAQDNLAWDLWVAVHGEKSFKLEELPQAVFDLLKALQNDQAVA